MKTTKILFALTLLVALALVAFWTPRAQAQKPTSTNWEYKVVAVSAQQTDESHLNELGGAGWELVAVTYRGFYYLKRAK